MTPQHVDNVNMTDGNHSFERPYHHGNLRAALIEAGLQALEQTDASELSLRAIAREVGVSANAAYRHFADKQGLLSAMAAEGFRRFSAAQQTAQKAAQRQASEGAPGTCSAATGHAYIAFAQAHPALF
ncbi:MAG: helix-turn-helix transcriptional regulator, partial [Burkholderiales bacterium]|nr:helix-turn-helix transcriptional regulator [Burkholderiales bacterium]